MKYDYFEVLHLKEKLQKLYGEEIYKKYEEDCKIIFIHLNDILSNYLTIDTKMPNYIEDNDIIYNNNIALYLQASRFYDEMVNFALGLEILYDNHLMIDVFGRDAADDVFFLRAFFNDVDKLNYSDVKNLNEFIQNKGYIIPDETKIYRYYDNKFDYLCDDTLIYFTRNPVDFEQNNDFENLFLSMRENEQYCVNRPKIYQKIIDNHNIK